MPNIFLDGELWYLPPSPFSQNIFLAFRFCGIFFKTVNLYRFGRDNFQEAMKLVNKSDHSDLDWKNFRFMVFDQPNHPGTYQQRFDSIGTQTSFCPSLHSMLITFLFRS